MINKIKGWLKGREDKLKLENWYSVTWDDERIYRFVSPPGKKPWNDSFRWADIKRICFRATDPLLPDDFLFFTSERPESYMIPSEAKGAAELWDKVIDKGLFDPKLAIEAATSITGIFCWPKENS